MNLAKHGSTCYSGGKSKKIASFRPTKAKLERFYLKNKNNRDGDMTQVVEHLPSKHRVLG
jgi:hypothetical protein